MSKIVDLAIWFATPWHSARFEGTRYQDAIDLLQFSPKMERDYFWGR
jgi:hypothetical protein